MVRFLDDWPRLEAGRFHRGLAATLVVLAALVALIALARHHQPAEAVPLTSVLGAIAVVGRRLVPAGPPVASRRR
jgi:hypothetical protein